MYLIFEVKTYATNWNGVNLYLNLPRLYDFQESNNNFHLI